MTPIRITKEANRWIARFNFDWGTKDVVKSAGFRFDPATKLWWTSDASVAAKLDPAVAAQAVNQAVEASRATSAVVAVPVPRGLAYLPYQTAGIAYAMGRSATLIGDEMGLGKTIQAIGVINADPSIKTVLVVCPASLKVNWSRELAKWLTRRFSIEIANGTFPASDIVIINYDILVKHRAAIDARQWDLLISDEIHYAKNPKARRTQALFGRWSNDPEKRITPIAAKRRLFLTGTPIVNRPSELWTLVRACDPFDLGRNFNKFMERYTNAYHNGYGWDFTGAANLPELQQRMRAKFMVRRLKADVLTELPAKRREVIILPPNGAMAAIDAELKVYEEHRTTIERAEKAAANARAKGDKDGYRAAVRELHAANKIAFARMAKVRHDTAVAKIPLVIEHLTDCLEAQEKVVVFCHHHDVGHALQEAFPGSAVVTGETSPNLRQAQVDKFQNDANCRLFIGSIHAAGLGITLTAAQLVVFAELDWVPGNISQSEDRLHRIGQRGSVLVQHLVFDRSVDSIMAHTIIAKQEVIEAALDRRGAPVEVEALPLLAATESPEEPVTAAIDDEEIPF